MGVDEGVVVVGWRQCRGVVMWLCIMVKETALEITEVISNPNKSST
jgi:hypothetical protein